MDIVVALGYGVIGFLLTIFADHWLETAFSIVRSPWYQSLWIPMAVGCATFAVASCWSRPPFRVSAAIGLLVTAPPYFWVEVKLLRVESESVVALGAVYLVLTAMGLSGAVLNPLAGVVTAKVLRGRRRRL